MKTNSSSLLQLFFCLALLLGLAKPDPTPLQDYCIANSQSPQSLFINGVPCVDPDKASSSHFATSALSNPGDTRVNKFNVTLTNTVNLPGLNTLGLTLARIDLAPTGIVPLHTHPRASEVTICLQGEIFVGFVDTSKRLFTQKLVPGDSFVFPKGLIHYLYNSNTKNPAVAVSGLNSQNPGLQLVAIASFASKPAIPVEVLEKAFQISPIEVEKIRKSLGG